MLENNQDESFGLISTLENSLDSFDRLSRVIWSIESSELKNGVDWRKISNPFVVWEFLANFVALNENEFEKYEEIDVVGHLGDGSHEQL